MAAPADLKSIDDFMRHWVSDRPDAVVLEEGDETLAARKPRLVWTEPQA